MSTEQHDADAYGQELAVALNAKDVLAAAERFPWALAAPSERHWPDGAYTAGNSRSQPLPATGTWTLHHSGPTWNPGNGAAVIDGEATVKHPKRRVRW
ncbi:hypothetical protein [Streptomyces sp. NPDC048521]|uniref:hypothetical protein n=1 Tax=Streptomyces sp. NPDC048521 TaxID=3365566 RepID=UPI00371A8B82